MKCVVCRRRVVEHGYTCEGRACVRRWGLALIDGLKRIAGDIRTG